MKSNSRPLVMLLGLYLSVLTPLRLHINVQNLTFCMC